MPHRNPLYRALMERRTTIYRRARDLAAAAGYEDRAFTVAEMTEWDFLLGEMDEISQRLYAIAHGMPDPGQGGWRPRTNFSR